MHHMDPQELLPASIDAFISVHKEFAKQDFKPTRDDMGYMSESAVTGGALGNQYAIFLPPIASNGTPE